MEEIIRLKANLDKMMEEGLDDAVLDSLIAESFDVEGLNDSIEFELS